jgi:hypothetical protein
MINKTVSGILIGNTLLTMGHCTLRSLQGSAKMGGGLYLKLTAVLS